MRDGLVELRDPDLWLVFGAESLQAVREPSLHGVGPRGHGIYRDPFLYRSNVCVEGWVRAILQDHGAADTVELRGLDVKWQ